MRTLTEEFLNAALLHIEVAPKDNGIIETLCIRPPRKRGHSRDINGNRKIVAQIEVSSADGVIGDSWKTQCGTSTRPDVHIPHPMPQVSILPKRVHDLLLQLVHYVHPGDTIIADIDTSMENFPVGSLIKIGNVVLQVGNIANYRCKIWRCNYGADALKFTAKPEHQPKRLGGFLCAVIVNGIINKNDRLLKISMAELERLYGGG